MPERVIPVCAPGFLARFGPFEEAAQLARAPLLHLETSGKPRWLTWMTWLAAQGVTREPAQGDLGLNTYGFVIQAALAEQGIALGWIGLVDQHLTQGSLVTVGREITRADCGYWLVPSPSVSGATSALMDWLVNEALASNHYHVNWYEELIVGVDHHLSPCRARRLLKRTFSSPTPQLRLPALPGRGRAGARTRP